MIIESLEVNGFLGRDAPLSVNFDPDFNIITGYNGSGKTNFLKLLWYLLSGNTHALLNEVEFSSVQLKTDLYSLRLQKVAFHTCRGTFTGADGETESFEDRITFEDDEHQNIDARDQFAAATMSLGSSIFFPTFRRIEGGFTINQNRSRNNLSNASRQKGELTDAVAGISRKLSNEEHTFVASVSTFDVAELLLRHFNEMSEKSNALQIQMSKNVIDKIRVFRRDTAKDSEARIGREAVDTLASIQELIETTDQQREKTMAPLSAVQAVVAKIFKHKGIQISRGINFGDAVNAISSDLLSAGEKQMLSFICYNAFIENSPIFIDEPELSLHVDWQRILFPTLESQKRNNQFIVATHSPFIYSKYPEKEIRLSNDRGGEIFIND